MRAALLGRGCWLVAQLLETQQYDGAELVHRWTILQSAWPATRSTPP